jgi:hypothetical protein
MVRITKDLLVSCEFVKGQVARPEPTPEKLMGFIGCCHARHPLSIVRADDGLAGSPAGDFLQGLVDLIEAKAVGDQLVEREAVAAVA